MVSKIDQIQLKKLVENATPFYERKQRLNQSLSLGIGLLGVSLGLAATIAGVVRSGDARIAAIFGACAATTQAILFAYPVEKRSAVYRILAAKNRNLEIELTTIQEQNQEQLHRILAEFKAISLEAAMEEASSGKIEEAKSLTPASVAFSNPTGQSAAEKGMTLQPQTSQNNSALSSS